MKFKDLLNNGKLWAVVYDQDDVDILTKTLSFWLDPIELRSFFTANKKDLFPFFKVETVEQAIFDTIADATSLACLILDINYETNLDELFRPLDNKRVREMILSREKAKGKRVSGHPSWLRIYALRLDEGIYLVTGGAIKLTHTMQERKHTNQELIKIKLVRDFLLGNNILDSKRIKEFEEEI